MTTAVSFEIAKLLKEKGFNEGSQKGYLENGELSISHYSGLCYNDDEDYPTKYAAPLIAEVVMWLFEKHGVYIHISPHGDEEELLKECKWWFSIYQNTIYNLRAGCKVTPGLNEYNSLTDAYEAAIEYILTKLILKNGNRILFN